MQPYRTPAKLERAAHEPLDHFDDATVLWVVFAAGLVPVTGALEAHGPYGAGPTIGMLFMAFAGRRLVSHYARRWRSRARASRGGRESSS